LFEPLTLTEILLRAGAAAGMGLCIGWNREKENKAAGLRTMALVSLGSAGVILASVEVTASLAADDVRLDPLRVVSGVIGGIGFLGAGSIIQSKGMIRGMTTAATIWAAAGIGIACGLGLFRLAGVLFALVATVLIALSWLKGSVLPEGDQSLNITENKSDAS
jgi:putative Mg2+ transporter-C (MgtC) family protein